jgi:hypothetical protein
MVKAHFFWSLFLLYHQVFQSHIVKTITLHNGPLETRMKEVGEFNNLIHTSIRRKPSLQVIIHDVAYLSVDTN